MAEDWTRKSKNIHEKMDRQILEPAFSSTFKKLPDISTHVEIQLCCDISEWVINDRAINLTLALSFQERPKYELWIIYYGSVINLHYT